MLAKRPGLQQLASPLRLVRPCTQAHHRSLAILARLAPPPSPSSVVVPPPLLPRVPQISAASSPRCWTRRSFSAPAGEQAKDEEGRRIWLFKEVESLVQDNHNGKNVILVDVREPHELLQTGKIPKAINIPIQSAPFSFHLTRDEFEQRYGFEPPAKDAPLVVYCKAGVRSRAAAAQARDAGWVDVGEYVGSWNDWVANGGVVEKVEVEKVEKAGRVVKVRK